MCPVSANHRAGVVSQSVCRLVIAGAGGAGVGLQSLCFVQIMRLLMCCCRVLGAGRLFGGEVVLRYKHGIEKITDSSTNYSSCYILYYVPTPPRPPTQPGQTLSVHLQQEPLGITTQRAHSAM